MPEFRASLNKAIIAPNADFYGTRPGIDKVRAKITRPLVVGSRLFIRLNVEAAPYPIFLAALGRKEIARHGFRDGRQWTVEEPAPEWR